MSAASALAYAHDMVGTRETSNNWGGQADRITRWIKASGYGFPIPWCQAFANTVAVEGGAVRPVPWPTKPAGFTPAFLNGSYSGQGYDPIPLSQAEPGDMVYFKWPGVSRDSCDHVGILVSMNASTVTCIEGNTSPGNGGSQNNGGGVYLRTRSRSLVAGAVSVPYSGGGSSGDAYRALTIGDSGRDVRALQVAINKRADGCGRSDRRVEVDGEFGVQTLSNGAWAAWILGIGDSQGALSEDDKLSRYVQHLVRNIDERNDEQKARAPHRRDVAGCKGA